MASDTAAFQSGGKARQHREGADGRPAWGRSWTAVRRGGRSGDAAHQTQRRVPAPVAGPRHNIIRPRITSMIEGMASGRQARGATCTRGGVRGRTCTGGASLARSTSQSKLLCCEAPWRWVWRGSASACLAKSSITASTTKALEPRCTRPSERTASLVLPAGRRSVVLGACNECAADYADNPGSAPPSRCHAAKAAVSAARRFPQHIVSRTASCTSAGLDTCPVCCLAAS